MQVLIVNQSEVGRLLPMPDCIEAMDEVLRTLARGEAILPLRQVLMLPREKGAFGVMPACLETPAAVGVKAITVFPGNHGTEYDSHQGAVLLWEMEHGRLLAVMDASSITAIRTAAVSAVATRLLAREEAGDLGLLGTGVQAATHLEAMLAVRKIRRVRAWSRDPGHVRTFAERARKRHSVEVQPAATAREAVAGADLICTTTSSREPVLMGEWIADGAHVNAVGSSVRGTRELDSAAVARSSLFVDRRESTLNEAGDFLMPKAEGRIGDDHIRAEVGELLLGTKTGRRTPQEVTLFKSLGLAVEDVAAAHRIYRNAVERKTGTWVELGGQREPQA
jgi:ornithine cyclodeaminase/alanine dehydrogenase-like protein (mu-crystallin family)